MTLTIRNKKRNLVASKRKRVHFSHSLDKAVFSNFQAERTLAKVGSVDIKRAAIRAGVITEAGRIKKEYL
jgi:hypothetical protein